MDQNNLPNDNNVTNVDNNTGLDGNRVNVSKKRSKVWVKILIGVAASFVGIFVGRFAVEMLDGNSVDRQIKKVDAYIEKVENHKAGELENGHFESEFWNLDLDFSDDGWTEIDKDEINKNAENTRSSMADTLVSGKGMEKVDEKILEKYKESVKVIPEVAMEYNSNDAHLNVVVQTISMYGLTFEDKEKIEEEITSGIKKSFTYSDFLLVNVDEKTIDGKKYKHIYGTKFVGLSLVYSNILFRFKNGMMIMIGYTYESGDQASEMVEELFG